jgi:hypothetical protein
MSPQRTRVVVRLVFAAVLAALPVQVGVREVFSEPYPGLYQPSFGGAPKSSRVAAAHEPRVTVRSSDGSVVAVPFRSLLPPTPVLELPVFRAAFGQDEVVRNPETRAWLRDQVLAWRPELDPSEVTVVWEDVEYDLRSGDRRAVAITRVTTVDVSES